MRGLLEKDIRLLFKRKQIFIVIIIVELFLGMSGSGTFAVLYFTMLAGIIAAGTLSYDEFDNGFGFLFTLPIDRKTYIREKYVLCIAACAVAWCISIVLYIVSGIAGGQNINFIAQFPEFVMIFPGMSMLATIILPLQLKYGSEKGKIALFVICGCLAAVFVFAKNLFSEESAIGFINIIHGIPMGTIMIGITALCAIVIFVTYSCSLRILSNKEL